MHCVVTVEAATTQPFQRLAALSVLLGVSSGAAELEVLFCWTLWFLR